MDLVADFLSGYTGNTARAYRRDIADWTTWLAGQGVEILAATRAQVDSFARALEAQGRSAATVARKLAAVSGLYAYAVDEGSLDRNPVVNVRRPKVSTESQTLGLDRDEAIALLAAAKADSARAYALVSLLLHTAARVGEALALDLPDLTVDGGHRVARFTGKGGKIRVLPLSASAEVLDAYLQGRATGPVFVTRTGGRWSQSEAYLTVQRLAIAAGIADADRVSPHSLRHTSITAALNAGAASRDVQDFAGHADPKTTNRYDRARHNLQRSPAHALGAYFAA